MSDKKVTQYCMTKKRATNFVIVNGRYMSDAPDNAKYFVHFPTPYSAKIIHAGETDELVEKVLDFGKTVEGKRMWNRINVHKYDESPDVDEDGDDIQDFES